jgi:tRNA threonylcarbamoyladenosine biosynthesis protein TsaB
MLSLIIDTTTERGLIAVAKDFEVIKDIELPFGLQNSKHALPLIRDTFLDLQLKTSHLTEVICGIGPGSYTGIRVGASIAMSLSFALSIPLIGVSSLQAYEPKDDSPYAALIDAKMGGVYVSINGQGPKVLSLEDLKSTIQGIKQFLSPVIEPLKSKLNIDNSSWYEMKPCAQRMLTLSRKEGIVPSKDASLELLYLQEWKPSSNCAS